MQVIFDESFYQVYTSDPAATEGRMEAITEALPPGTKVVSAHPASQTQIEAVHRAAHIDDVRRQGLYEIAALAAGATIQAARIGLETPAMALVRPPGHHASSASAWGFCYFNNVAVALKTLKTEGVIDNALVLDIDLHYGDGTVNILGEAPWVTICNPASRSRQAYLDEVSRVLANHPASMVAISAGFDHHIDDWGGLLATDDYTTIGRLVKQAARSNHGGCFAALEGGYNHAVLGLNVAALLRGLESG